jgi:hypothetical protein
MFAATSAAKAASSAGFFPASMETDFERGTIKKSYAPYKIATTIIEIIIICCFVSFGIKTPAIKLIRPPIFADIRR